jgi:translation initiation factor 2-alpha kinase 4
MAKERENERSYGFWSPSRCDVYIASFGPGQLDLRLDVCGELWKAGISADLQYDDDRSLEEVVLDCQSQNVLYVCLSPDQYDRRSQILLLRYILIPRPNRPFIKIRSVLGRSEEEGMWE